MEIKVGSKVRFKTSEDVELDLIAIEHQPSEIYDTWLCVNPFCYAKTGECTLYNCFTEDLKLGWNKSPLASFSKKSQIEVIEDFAKRLKDNNPYFIIGSDISETELVYSQGYNDHHTKINNKIDELVNDFKQDT